MKKEREGRRKRAREADRERERGGGKEERKGRREKDRGRKEIQSKCRGKHQSAPPPAVSGERQGGLGPFLPDESSELQRCLSCPDPGLSPQGRCAQGPDEALTQHVHPNYSSILGVLLHLSWENCTPDAQRAGGPASAGR